MNSIILFVCFYFEDCATFFCNKLLIDENNLILNGILISLKITPEIKFVYKELYE